MPAEVTLNLSDYTRGKNGKKSELPGVSMDATIAEIKKLVVESQSIDMEPSMLLLFIGSLNLEDDKKLRDFNKSNRSKLSVNIYERVDLNLKIKTLQHLKKMIADELADPDQYSSDKLKLVFNRNMLFEDKQVLKDAGLKPDSTLTLYVNCCYWIKKPDENRGGKPAAATTQPAAADADAEQQQEEEQGEDSAADNEQKSPSPGAGESPAPNSEPAASQQ